MTESEMVEAANSYFDLAVDMLSFYMTITSGYLIVAFLAGKRLTISQMSVISTLYVFGAVVSTYSAFAWCMHGIHYTSIRTAAESSLPTYATPVVPAVLSAILAAGILASLKFMWDIRHQELD